MNIISFDIELTREKKVKDEILDLIKTCISKAYKAQLTDREILEKSWNDLPFQEFVAVFSSKHLLYSFTFENVQVFLFKKVTDGVVSVNDLTITAFAISEKEINLILKSSFSKLQSIFNKNVYVNVIEGTQVNIYPFDADKNDVVNPDTM